MKKSILLIALLITTTLSFSQKKEKVKGSKIVTVAVKKIESFNALEVADNLEIFLIKGTENSLEIEADDNLHEAIDIAISGNTLRLSTTKDITSSKKLSVRVTYTNDFNSIIARNEANITALADLELDNISLKNYDYSKLFINAKCKNITIQCDDKSKGEVNIKAENTTINLLKNASIKALVTSTNLTFDMYQKTEATVEGDVQAMKLRLDNNANFNGKTLIIKDLDLTTESYTTAIVNVKANAIIQASGKSEVQLFGEQKIDLRKFTDSAVLIKKPSK
ncbi:DUF2807 domain-containing protein [Flavobacterium sp. SUN046]|uniref:GIN domain-containing protein n=1 Tax=Flavobacterium sp. SUN046 TaxID=3002440 RepID=UPI002DC005FB|nr:DUF2807 domain-containing protein [Flavobacterium sp. SUN046]MEC4049379.1 DUF2807 domain-containing protein [Flavobacterium sp. SUN046]